MAFILLNLVIVVFFVVMVVLIMRQVQSIRRYRATLPQPIGILPAVGPGAVIGQASGDLQNSLFAQAPCVFWQAQVREYRSSGKSGRWVTVFEQTSQQPFTINDGTGTIVIQPNGAQSVLRVAMREKQGLFRQLSPETLTTLERFNISQRHFLGVRRQLEITERRIEPGDQIYTLGHLNRWQDQRMLASSINERLILADRSLQELLTPLYWQLGGLITLTVVMTIGLLFVFSQIFGIL